MTKPGKELSEKEIAKRRDETLKHMLKTPPKPHSEMTGQRQLSKQSKAKQSKAKQSKAKQR